MKASEIVAVLTSQKLNDDFSLDLGNGIVAKQTAAAYKNPEHPSFILEQNGIDKGNLEDVDEATLQELSDIIVAKFGEAFSYPNTLEDELTPDGLRDTPEDDDLVPLKLRDPEPDESLEPDPLGLTPDALREKKGPAEPTLEDELTPDMLRDEK